MKKIKLTKGKFATVDDDDFEYLNQWKWQFCVKYAMRIKYSDRKDRSKKGEIVFMHRVINNTPDGLLTDHINGDTLDNRKCNLRDCTNQQNQGNRKKTLNTTSKYKGVHWHKNKKRWQSNIKINGVKTFLGSFKVEEGAALAYNKAAEKHMGAFALINKVSK